MLGVEFWVGIPALNTYVFKRGEVGDRNGLLWEEIMRLCIVETCWYHSKLKGVRIDGGRRGHGAEGERGHEGSLRCQANRAAVSRVGPRLCSIIIKVYRIHVVYALGGDILNENTKHCLI